MGLNLSLDYLETRLLPEERKKRLAAKVANAAHTQQHAPQIQRLKNKSNTSKSKPSSSPKKAKPKASLNVLVDFENMLNLQPRPKNYDYQIGNRTVYIPWGVLYKYLIMDTSESTQSLFHSTLKLLRAKNFAAAYVALQTLIQDAKKFKVGKKKGVTKQEVKKVLTPITLDTSDPINQLYLKRTTGTTKYDKRKIYNGKDVMAYLSYLRKVEDIKFPEKERFKPVKLSKASQDFLSRYRIPSAVSIAKQNGGKGRLKLTISELSQTMDQIFKGEVISPNAAAFLLQNEKTAPIAYADLLSLVGLKGDVLRVGKLPFMVTDKMFLSGYKIGHVFSVSQKDQPSLKEFKYRRYAAHGTSSMAILSILVNGFISSSKVKAARMTGQALGAGTYFCRPSQLSKATGYISGPTKKRPSYIVLAELGYNHVIDAHGFGFASARKTGDLVWAYAVGAYGRDELVVPSGSQVRITHIVEVLKK